MKKHKFYSPLLLPLVCVVLGIYTQQRFLAQTQLLILLLLGISALTLFLVLIKKIPAAKICALPLFICIGCTVIALQKTDHVATCTLLKEKPLYLYATIVDKGLWGDRNNKNWIRITVHEAFDSKTDTHNHTQFDLLCYFAYKNSLAVADTITIQNAVIKAATTKTATDNASYQDYLIKEGMLSSLFLTKINQCKRINRPEWSLKRWLWKLRHTTYQSMRRKLSKKAAAYVGLIFLGNKEHEALPQLRQAFNLWGLAHYLARAGLHIILFIMIWTFIFGFIPIHIKIKQLLLVLICFVYDLLSWASIPFVRALYGFFLIKGGQLTGQQTNYLHLLSLICLSVLLFNPMQLFFLDFQLTFAITFALALMAPVIHTKQKSK